MELIAVKILIDSVPGLLHDRPGNVDLRLAARLLGGAISVPWLRRSLCTIRLARNARMQWAPAMH